ncbi:hypothetical protein QAD02_010779 [Eretmocerus hayati]|uniref:Uncharacterized protein n=1 Tax=Eretmocerus hayati TaxID=131215 RepID=A0ACC2NUW4_9HYME|nr:hypothetical protein QAD02_010779 [Eretmocerus hayati]
MHPSGDGVLCKVDIARTAVKAQNARESSRQLLIGVFKLSAIANRSLTGRNKSGSFTETPQQKFLSGRAIQGIVCSICSEIGEETKLAHNDRSCNKTWYVEKNVAKSEFLQEITP